MKLFTYRLDNTGAPKSATDSKMRAALKRSAQRWNATGAVKIIPSGELSPADIVVKWHDAEWGKIATTSMPSRTIKLNRKHAFGWNWLTRLFAADMDLTLTHELGHAIGLGHSDDPSSIMFAQQFNRAHITVKDINQLKSIHTQ